MCDANQNFEMLQATLSHTGNHSQSQYLAVRHFPRQTEKRRNAGTPERRNTKTRNTKSLSPKRINNHKRRINKTGNEKLLKPETKSLSPKRINNHKRRINKTGNAKLLKPERST